MMKNLKGGTKPLVAVVFREILWIVHMVSIFSSVFLSQSLLG